ncbi:MAG: iron(III) transport system permease protein [Trebonia sp.]|jgi:iron(III) transport system permease protein|nr:iron(III) transport system permease protein [Trebonia sp.]
MTSRGSGRSRLGVVALCVVCLVLFVWPVAMLAYGTLRTAPPGQGGRWSTSGLTSALTSWDVWHSFINSLILSAATVALSTALAIYLAWLVTRTRTPLRQVVTPVAVLIFAVPPMFYTLSWAMLGQQPGGLIDKALQGMFGATPVNVQSWYGLIIVSVLGATAAQYLLLLGPFRALNPALEEASLVCGASRLRSVFQIEIPALGPAILGVMILGFVLGMGLLTTPLLLGEPAGIYVLPTEIYRLIEGETPADYAGASTLSLLLVLVVLALVAIQSKLLGQRKFVTVTGKSSRREAIDIGPWKWLGTLVIAIFTLFALVLPLGQFVLGSFESYFGVYSHFTTGNYGTVFHQPGTSQAFTTTIIVAVVAGFVATLLGVLITLAAQRSRSRLRRLPDICVWLLWAVPGITLSLGIIWAYLSVPGLKSLYGTQWIVLLALIVGTTPIASRAVGGSIAQVARELEEAARTSGASALRATAGILVRLIAPSFAVSWLLSGIVASGNLDIPILLASANNQTVPLLAYDLYDNGSLSQAAATFCVFIGIIAAVLVAAAVARLMVGIRRRAAQRQATRQAALAPAS